MCVTVVVGCVAGRDGGVVCLLVWVVLVWFLPHPPLPPLPFFELGRLFWLLCCGMGVTGTGVGAPWCPQRATAEI